MEGHLRSSQQDSHCRPLEQIKVDHRRSESYRHLRRVYPGPDPCQCCPTLMALRGRAGYLTAQMDPSVANIVAEAVSWMQEVGYSEVHHHDLELTR